MSPLMTAVAGKPNGLASWMTRVTPLTGKRRGLRVELAATGWNGASQLETGRSESHKVTAGNRRLQSLARDTTKPKRSQNSLNDLLTLIMSDEVSPALKLLPARRNCVNR